MDDDESTWMMDEFDEERDTSNVTMFQYAQEIGEIDGWMMIERDDGWKC